MITPNPPEATPEEQPVTGFWTGVFDAGDHSFEATPFHAFLHEEGGLVSGESVEANGFSSDPILELFASLEGWCDAAEIEFVKTYEDAVGAGFSLRFEGAFEMSGRRIRGIWTLLDAEAGGYWGARSGPFVMDMATAGLETASPAGADRRGER